MFTGVKPLVRSVRLLRPTPRLTVTPTVGGNLSKAAIAIMDLPDRYPATYPNRAYGGWIWAGPLRFAEKVVEHLESLAELLQAFEAGGRLVIIPAEPFPPAWIRQIEQRVTARLTNGPSFSFPADIEPVLYVPRRVTNKENNKQFWLNQTVFEPLGGTPFAWTIVQRAAEETERIWSVIAGEQESSKKPVAVTRGSNAAVLLQVLATLNATCPERLVTAEEAVKMADAGVNFNDYKKVVSMLKDNGYPATYGRLCAIMMETER